MMKNRESDNMRKIFKFATSNFDIDREVDLLAGTAIGHLSGIYFKREEFKEFIEDFSGLQKKKAKRRKRAKNCSLEKLARI
jgi:hypothetical protein